MGTSENSLKHFQNIENITPRIYYHYTSLDALFNIVKEKSFRMTSLRSTNDKRELFYSVDNFLVDLNNVCENEADENTKKCLYRLKRSIDDNIKIFEKDCKSKHTPYAFCLSKKRDNLTHWDRYACNCTGVCIGFNVAAFDVLYKRTGNRFFGTSLFDIGEILYTQENILQCIRNTTIDLVNSLAESTKIDSEFNFKASLSTLGFMYMAIVYRRIMKFTKNSSFIDEDEIRLYHETESISKTLSLIKEMTNDLRQTIDIDFEVLYHNLIKELRIEEEHFMMSRAGIRSYHNLHLEQIWGSGLIPEIILGPMCVQNRKELERFLRNNGLANTKICLSKTPIR